MRSAAVDVAARVEAYFSNPCRQDRMIRNRRVRRTIAAVLMVLGGGVMLLAPSVGPGLVAFGCGVLLELVGLALERRDPR